MDITQIVLVSVIIVLTLFLTVIGFQAFFVLKDFRRTLGRLNKLFDDADDLVGQVKKPISSASNLLTAMSAGMGLAHLFKGKKGEGKK